MLPSTAMDPLFAKPTATGRIERARPPALAPVVPAAPAAPPEVAPAKVAVEAPRRDADLAKVTGRELTTTTTTARTAGPGLTQKLVDPKRAQPLDRSLDVLLQWSPEELAEARAHKVVVAADHNGAGVAAVVAAFLRSAGVAVQDLAAPMAQAAQGQKFDYATAALPALVSLTNGAADRVILICGNGIGMRDVAQQWPGARVKYGEILHEVRSGRKAEDVNVLALGARLVGDPSSPENADLARAFAKTFVATPHQGMPERYQAQTDVVRQWAEVAQRKGGSLSMADFADVVASTPTLQAMPTPKTVPEASMSNPPLGAKAAPVGGSVQQTLLAEKSRAAGPRVPVTSTSAAAREGNFLLGWLDRLGTNKPKSEAEHDKDVAYRAERQARYETLVPKLLTSKEPFDHTIKIAHHALNEDKSFSTLVRVSSFLMGNTLDAGEYRTAVNRAGEYLAPAATDVPLLMERFGAKLTSLTSTAKNDRDARLVAAWSLTIMIRVHPFMDGNGRTARAVMNLVLKKTGQQTIDFPADSEGSYKKSAVWGRLKDHMRGFVGQVGWTLAEGVIPPSDYGDKLKGLLLQDVDGATLSSLAGRPDIVALADALQHVRVYGFPS